MFLRSLQLENFRAVRRARLVFDETTVLIGENDCGKSSLLEALVLALGHPGPEPPAFEPHHFHREPCGGDPCGPILIRLGFREREPGEWGQPEPLAALLPAAGGERRRLELEFHARATDAAQEVAWRLLSPADGASTSDPATLAWLREQAPVIHLAGGMLTGRGPADAAPEPVAPDPELPAPLAELGARVQRHAAALLAGTSSQPGRDLARGFRAARELIDHLREHAGQQRPHLALRVAEILGRQPQPAEASSGLPGSGGNSERIGILLLVAALLRASRGSLHRALEPIWILEDPEAHLHPMSLASIASFLTDIRWQKLIATQSGTLVGSAPLASLRRLRRHHGEIHDHRVRVEQLSKPELRRIAHHLGKQHRGAVFHRVWLLVEGESETWILPQLARLLGYHLDVEGVACIEFAQSGLSPLVRVAEQLGIGWHVLVDGDRGGEAYLDTLRRQSHVEQPAERITILPQPDLEHCFWEHGYDRIIADFAGLSEPSDQPLDPRRAIQRALKKLSKPDLALRLLETAVGRDSPGVPEPLADALHRCVALAREG